MSRKASVRYINAHRLGDDQAKSARICLLQLRGDSFWKRRGKVHSRRNSHAVGPSEVFSLVRDTVELSAKADRPDAGQTTAATRAPGLC